MEKNFLEFLRKRKLYSSENSDNNEDELNLWLEELNVLFNCIKSWLSSAQNEGLLNIIDGYKSISETKLGEYRAPKLTLESGNNKVEIVPIGKHSLDGDGRVNIASIKGLHILLKYKGRGWYLFDKYPHTRIEKLNKELFFELIMDLM